MSTEVVESYCETVFNFAQRHKKHNLVEFQTEKKKRLRANEAVLVACTPVLRLCSWQFFEM